MEEYQPDINEATAQAEVAEHQVKETLGSDQTSFAEFLHDTEQLPECITKHFALFFNRELGLTNLDKDDIREIMLRFRICKRNYHIYTPRFLQTADNNILMDQLEARIQIKLLRSVGGRMRDRALFHTTLTSHERPQEQKSKGGIFSRFKRSAL